MAESRTDQTTCGCSSEWRRPKPNGTCATCGGWLPGEQPRPFFASLASDDEEPVIVRRDGRAPCPTCGVEVRRHPYSTKVLDYQGQPFVHLLCDGTLVKT